MYTKLINTIEYKSRLQTFTLRRLALLRNKSIKSIFLIHKYQHHLIDRDVATEALQYT